MSEYNEKEILDDYVLTYFSHLLTDAECKAMKSGMVETMAMRSSDNVVKLLREKCAVTDNEEVALLLKNGYENFRRTLYDRLLEQHKDEIFSNRCLQCGKLPRTAKAKQCPWCFHSWRK